MNLNSVCDDIEEGEIVSASSDSDVPSKAFCSKRKSLPRRYVLEKNKKLHSKHKRKCKYSHHHVKKATLKMSSVKLKGHKKLKICSKQDPISNSVKKNARTKSHSNVRNPKFYSTLFSEISSNLKTSKDSDKNVDRSVLHTAIRKCSSLNVVDSPKLPDSYDKSFNELKKNGSLESNSIPSCNLNASVQSAALVGSDKLVNENGKLKKILNASNDTPLNVESERKAEESEDEDELRRIALATCAKKLLSENETEKNVQICSVDAIQTPPIDVQPVTDNYEIVDMELDDNIGSVDTMDDMFVIDTKPVAPDDCKKDFLEEAGDTKHLPATKLDEEFEEELLRAMLLANLNSQLRKDRDDALVKKEILKNSKKIEKIISKPKEMKDNKKIEKCISKPKEMLKDNNKIEKCISKPKQINKLPLLSQKSKPVALPAKKVDAKVICPPKAQPDNTVHMPQNRIVISLADESSSDESDAEVENNGPVAAPSVSSLEALICSARIKSDQSKTGAENTNVSYLSKAQQEQYNLYKKILNASDGEQALVNGKDFSHLTNYQLKLKEKKLSIALSNYMKEKNLMANERKECLMKKAAFLKMKLKAQRLKEEWMETREMMKTNSQLYQKSVNHFKTLKKSVMKREELICNLKAECTKLGVSVKGTDYVLPAVSAQTPSLVDKTNS
ncbi:uncharacterized protein LOC129217774 [Uloborus diversus]|uniref:uncharacterized protein LOC129217774 n=1 Tax=Uloborus diversus TaxID=327109 RepID=UPI002409F6A3|nr:uncharacterized protein LOC129217774 [Uloborus diversus]